MVDISRWQVEQVGLIGPSARAEDQDVTPMATGYFTIEEIAARLRCSRATVLRMRYQKGGDFPAPIRVGGKRLLYPVAAVEAYLARLGAEAEKKATNGDCADGRDGGATGVPERLAPNPPPDAG
jgi:excisionase family DNA binding protein